MTKQFEQAKREFAEKWCIKVIECMKGDDYIMHAPDEMLSDLTALLEQHKEVITAEIKRADFAEWLLNHATVNEEFTPPKWTAYLSGYQSKTYWTTNELYDVWLKNVKK